MFSNSWLNWLWKKRKPKEGKAAERSCSKKAGIEPVVLFAKVLEGRNSFGFAELLR